MDRRLKLDGILRDILGSGNVYFQPPESIKLKYPCIIYKRASDTAFFADDMKYKRYLCYDITVIDLNPDSQIPDKVSNLPLCSYSGFFVSDNLNHDMFKIYI